MATINLPAHVKFDNTIGAAIIGFAASSMVYGVLCAQIWTYYHLSFHKVDKYYKFLVPLVLLLETIDQAFIGHCVYFYAVTNYANPLGLLVSKPPWTFILQMTVGAAVGTIVKTVFSLRVWRLSNHNNVLTAFLLLLNFAQMGITCWYTITCFSFATLRDLNQGQTIGSLALGAGLITDITIALALCFYLQKLRSEFSRSSALIRSLTVNAIDTGILTSAFSLTTLVLYNVNPNNLIFIACYFLVAKLYSTTFLASMNARQAVTQGRSMSDHREVRSGDPEAGFGSKLAVLSQGRSGSRGRRHFSRDSPTEIHMKIDVHKEVSNLNDGPWSSVSDSMTAQ